MHTHAHIHTMHINLLSLPRLKLHRSAHWRVLPSAEELLPCVLILASIFLGIVLVLLRINGI